MGHANRAAVGHMVKNPSYDMNANSHPEELTCKTCVQTKASIHLGHRSLVQSSQQKTLHMDVGGALRKWTYGGCHLFVTFTVTSHAYIGVKLVKRQNGISLHCRNFILWTGRKTGIVLKSLQRDNTRELLGMKIIYKKMASNFPHLVSTADTRLGWWKKWTAC